MDAANPISQPKTLRLESRSESELDYWQGNLRWALDESSRTIEHWLEQTRAQHAEVSLSIHGPQPPLLARWTEPTPGNSPGSSAVRCGLLRFPTANDLAEPRLQELEASAFFRLWIVQRVATSLDRLHLNSGDLKPSDPVTTLRQVHLSTSYKLTRQTEIARRGAKLHLAEFERLKHCA